MWVEIFSVLKPFLAFASSFQHHAIHNMLVLMPNLQFKNLQFIYDFVGFELAMQVVVEYDYEIFMPLQLIFYDNLTSIFVDVVLIGFVTFELDVSGVLAPIEVAT